VQYLTTAQDSTILRCRDAGAYVSNERRNVAEHSSVHFNRREDLQISHRLFQNIWGSMLRIATAPNINSGQIHSKNIAGFVRSTNLQMLFLLGQTIDWPWLLCCSKRVKWRFNLWSCSLENRSRVPGNLTSPCPLGSCRRPKHLLSLLLGLLPMAFSLLEPWNKFHGYINERYWTPFCFL
jgi:hypothetical protein